LPLRPFFHHTLYKHHYAFHYDLTIVGFYWDPTRPCHFVQFIHVFACIYILEYVPIYYDFLSTLILPLSLQGITYEKTTCLAHVYTYAL